MPPPRLAARVLEKAKRERAAGTLVVPHWKSAPFWPKIAREGRFLPFIEDSFIFHCREIKKGRGNNGIFGDPNQNFTMIGLKLRF